jgi:predicted transcriptional regulator
MDSLLVSDLMDAKPLTIDCDIGVIVAMRQLLAKGVTAASVVDGNGELLGILSEADCMKGTLMGGYFEEIGDLVRDRMSKEVCTVMANTDLVTAAELMLKNKRRVLPVVNGKKVVGALCRTRVIAEIINKIDHPAHA